MRPEVQDDDDYRRIAALPRRTLHQVDADAWAAVLTEEYLCSGAQGEVRPWQAMSVVECVENRGGFLALPVGIGKTWLTAMLARAMGISTSMLIIPPSLKAKTYSDFSSYVGTWRLPSPMPRVTTTRELVTENGATLLKKLRPGLVVIDEADDLANIAVGVPRRIDRHIVDMQDDTCIVCLSGTPSRMSIMGYWHQLIWTLRDRAPVPQTLERARMWAAALDYRKNPNAQRVGPGALGATLEHARKWYYKRLIETPGVVVVDGDSAGDIPLKVRTRLAKEDPAIDAHYERFLVEQESPSGIPCVAPLDRWRLDGQIGCGLFLKYKDPQPPVEWLDARRDSAYVCRVEIDASTWTSKPIDTEKQAIKRLKHLPVIQEWLAIRGTYTPKTEAVWLSASVLETVLEWLAESDTPGIVWCGGVEFAEALAYVSRLSYYGRKATDQRGRGLHLAEPDRSMIASWNANKKGFNLQAWRRMLIVHPPSSAKWLEQIFGRAHRQGQTAPVVVDILATSGGTLDGFEAAIGEAGFAKQTIGLTQKILRAQIVRCEPEITRSNRFRWARRGHDGESKRQVAEASFRGYRAGVARS